MPNDTPVKATIDARTNPITVKPDPVQCDEEHQTIIWTLVPGADAFEDPPIRFPYPPKGHTKWPGADVTVSGNQATAVVGKKLKSGKETYKYTIYPKARPPLDPDIENTGSGPRDGPGARRGEKG